MGKLYKEAERVKLILSANTECFAQVENLLEDIDFKIAVNREDFLKLNEDYLVPERITRPIERGRLLSVYYLGRKGWCGSTCTLKDAPQYL